MKSDAKESGPFAQRSPGAERVARCRRKLLMMGGRKITLWLDKDAADALGALEIRHNPFSATAIIGRLIREAARSKA